MNLGDPRIGNRMGSDDLEARILRDHPHLVPNHSLRNSLIALAILLIILGVVILWMWSSWTSASTN